MYAFEGVGGKPIAVLLNYGIEPVVYAIAKTEVSGDVPGATSRYVEEMLGGGVVALFTVGSPGSPAYRVWSDTDPRFVVDDAAYALNTYPATDTRAAVGCAENGFIESALTLIEATR